MNGLIAVLNIVLPVFLVIGLGFGLSQRKFISEDMNAWLSRLVFYVLVPALLFRSAARTPLAQAISPAVILGAVGVNVIFTLIVYMAAFRSAPSRRGVIAQGAYRTNLVFVGLPIIANAFGDQVLGGAAVLIGIMTVLYNVMAVIVLTLPHQDRGDLGGTWRKSLREMALNPLILSSGAGLLFSGFHILLPASLDLSLEMIGRTATPIALLSVGASLDLGRLRAEWLTAAVVSVLKLIVYPGLNGLAIYLLGVRGRELQFCVLLLASSTAVVSPIMAREMRGDAQLASAIVIGSTLAALLTISLWLAFFKLTGL